MINISYFVRNFHRSTFQNPTGWRTKCHTGWRTKCHTGWRTKCHTGWRTKCHTTDCARNTFLLLQKYLTSSTELILIG